MNDQTTVTNALTGAEALVHSLLESGIDTCFANPGTSEMHFVAALDRIAGMRCVLGLHETVVTGMADGYWRIARRPAATLLHCGPGLANGLANLHNARRGRSGVVNIVGDQAARHRPFDAPLTADTEGLARAVSAFVRTTSSAAETGRDAAEAVRAARTAPGQVATMILPADASWGAGGQIAPALPVPAPAAPDPGAIKTAARLAGEGCLIFVTDAAFAGEGAALLAGIAAQTGARVMTHTLTARAERGRGQWPLDRIPYRVDDALAALAPFDRLILIGAEAPVAFFAYPGKPSMLHRPDAQIHVLARPEQDAVAAVRALAACLGAAPLAPPAPPPLADWSRDGAVTAEGLSAMIAAHLPEGAIVVDEAISFGGAWGPAYDSAAPHTWIGLTGGAIGDGFPLATGAAIAAAGTGRRVVSVQADGSGLYSLQALWTQARERLDCTTIVLSNRSYAILLGEYQGVGATPGPTARAMMELERPEIDWPALARGFGVEGARAGTLGECADLLAASLTRPGPFLIQLDLP